MLSTPKLFRFSGFTNNGISIFAQPFLYLQFFNQDILRVRGPGNATFHQPLAHQQPGARHSGRLIIH
jgi:hypothetical protein